ncbi:MAG TPA: DUF4389 domain-containing protein [Conexibacter sp.]|nr:DUF4389 domain-containing protein [Conexibacter sp.]
MAHPVQLIVRDDLQRSRATVFFRLLLAIPHFLWLALWGVATLVVVAIHWIVLLVRGTPWAWAHEFTADFVRYALHVNAYVYLLANPYPGFGGDGYAVDVELPPPAPQGRWGVLLRLPLALPALLLGFVLTSGGWVRGPSSQYGGLLTTTAVLGWFVSLALGRMPRGLRDAGAYALGYAAQVYAYAFLLTDRYPDSDPLAMLDDLPAAEHPIALAVEDDRRRSRATVFFRLLLAIPHYVWLTIWGIAAIVAAIANWFAVLFTGRSPDGPHRFLAEYLRYATHVSAYLYLAADPYPKFEGHAGSYPVELVVAGSERQNRWTALFRLVLAFPAFLIAGSYGGMALVAAVLGWFASLARGEMPRGLRNAIALSLRYSQQTFGYLLLLTDRYPYSGPVADPEQAEQAPAFLPPDAYAVTPA